MRIAFLSTSSLDYPSPRGRWLPIAHELARQGHEPILLMLHQTYDQLAVRRFEHDGVRCAYVGQMHVYGEPGQRKHFRPLELARVSLQGMLALCNATLACKPDIVHVAKPQPINGPAGLLAARLLRRPLYLDWDDYEAGANRFSAAWQRRVVEWCEDHLPQQATGVTVNTRFLYDRALSLGIAPRRLAYVPNGVHPPHFQRPPDHILAALRASLGLENRPIALYLGTISTVAHGVGLLLEAFALALQRIPAARLLMVGDGDERTELQMVAERLGIAHAVQWLGAVPSRATPAYLALADCSVDPVYNTPAAAARSPLKIVESMAVGVPVVTGDVGDRAEMLQDAGIIVAPDAPHALADGITAILANQQLRANLAARARARAENYRWERLALEWINLYQQLQITNGGG